MADVGRAVGVRARECVRAGGARACWWPRGPARWSARRPGNPEICCRRPSRRGGGGDGGGGAGMPGGVGSMDGFPGPEPAARARGEGVI